MSTALDPRISAVLGPAYTGQSAKLTAALVTPDGTVSVSGMTFSEPVAGSGVYQCATATDPTFEGLVYYTWTGTPAIPLLPPDVLTSITPITTLDLGQAIPVSPAPTIGTVGEALAAARAAAIGNESKSGNAVALLASDDSTVLATATYSPSIASPTSRSRS